MTNPPEYDAPRTETQRLADDIAQAMRELRQLSKASSPEDSRSTSVTAGAGKLDAARRADW